MSTATHSPVDYQVAYRIATITVNRPDKLNALSAETLTGLGEAIDRARDDDSVGGVILTGAGRAFVAGADISQFPTMSESDARGFVGGPDNLVIEDGEGHVVWDMDAYRFLAEGGDEAPDTVVAHCRMHQVIARKV